MAPALVLQLVLLQALTADLIVIDPGTLDPELTRAAIQSCNEAYGPEPCRADTTEAAGGEQEPAPPSTPEDAPAARTPAERLWYARVIWDDTQLRARVEIRQGSRDAEPENVREVEFSAADEPVQRYRAAGLIVASYVVERVRTRELEAQRALDAERERQAQAARAAQAAADAEAAAAERARSAARAGVDLGLVVGPGLDPGPARLGLTLRGFVRLPVGLPLAATLSLRGARRGGDVPVVWLDGGAGLALQLAPADSPVALEPRAEVIVEWVAAEAEDAATGTREEDGVWRLGARLGLELHLALGAGFFLFAGGDLSVMQRAVSVDVGDQEVGKTGRLEAGGLAGFRFAR